ncbi:MAG: MarR family winged helix-turn-helix transcriptional regulator [bacterium]
MQPDLRARRRAGPIDHPDLQRDAEELHEALSELVRVYQFRDRTSICCHGISVTQCYALEAVLQKESITMNELAAMLWLDKSTASRVVDGLEEAGYVRRAPNPSDGRSLLLEPTSAGRALHGRIVRGLIAEKKTMLQDFDPGVRREVARLIARLARAAAGRARGTDQGCEAACEG